MMWLLTQILPLIVIIVCYSRIFREVRQQVTNTRRISIRGKSVLRSYKAVTTIFLIIVTFVITWLPEFLVDVFIMLHIIEPKNESPLTFAVSVVTRWLYYLSPTLDPYIYALRHKRLQSAIKQTFCLPKYRGDVDYSSDMVAKAIKRISVAVQQSIKSDRLKRNSSRILDSVSGSVTSLGSLISSHIQPHVDPNHSPKILRRRPLSADMELDQHHPLRHLQFQPRPKSWMTVRRPSRKVSVVQEQDSPSITRSEISHTHMSDRREIYQPSDEVNESGNCAEGINSHTSPSAPNFKEKGSKKSEEKVPEQNNSSSSTTEDSAKTPSLADEAENSQDSEHTFTSK